MLEESAAVVRTISGLFGVVAIVERVTGGRDVIFLDGYIVSLLFDDKGCLKQSR